MIAIFAATSFWFSRLKSFFWSGHIHSLAQNRATIGVMSISARRVFLALTTIAVVLYLCHVVLLSIEWESYNWYEFIQLFDMDHEVNIPTWFNQLLFLILALVLFLTGLIKQKIGDAWYKHWWVLGAGMVLLSADETAMMHEKIGIFTRVSGLHDWLVSSGGAWFNYSWWVVASIALVVAGCIMFKFFLHLPKRTQYLLAASVALFLFGSVVLDAYAGWYNSIDPSIYVSHFITGLEECCEMVGIILAIYTFLDYLRVQPAKVTKQLPMTIVR
jgi:hypothetical protein